MEIKAYYNNTLFSYYKGTFKPLVKIYKDINCKSNCCLYNHNGIINIENIGLHIDKKI